MLVYHREVDYLLAVLWNHLFGGILVECIGYVIGIAFLRVGINPMTTYVDNVLVSVLSVAVLWFFNNEWFVIVTSLLLGSAQNVLGKVMHRREAEQGQK